LHLTVPASPFFATSRSLQPALQLKAVVPGVHPPHDDRESAASALPSYGCQAEKVLTVSSRPDLHFLTTRPDGSVRCWSPLSDARRRGPYALRCPLSPVVGPTESLVSSTCTQPGTPAGVSGEQGSGESPGFHVPHWGNQTTWRPGRRTRSPSSMSDDRFIRLHQPFGESIERSSVCGIAALRLASRASSYPRAKSSLINQLSAAKFAHSHPYREPRTSGRPGTVGRGT
jgi:hypothetical protein